MNTTCKQCNKELSQEGHDGTCDCPCEACCHQEWHYRTDWMNLPSVKDKTPNQLEGFEVDA